MNRLLADIGGTNTRCAIMPDTGGPQSIAAFENRDFADLSALLNHYIETLPQNERPATATLAVAAPIRADHVRMININWEFSTESLRQSLQMEKLRLFNDFEALAMSLTAFGPEDIVQIGGGNPVPDRPKAVIGPGTGLGVASLIRHGDRWIAVSGEGGHVTLPATTDLEAELISKVRTRFGHCSAERLISGPGLELLHELLHDMERVSAAEISARAEAGNQDATATLNIFFELLGTVAANLALTIGAFGGVYVGGGIIPRHADRFKASGFRERFEAKGRYGDYLKSIPTWLIVAEHPTLNGLAAIRQHET